MAWFELDWALVSSSVPSSMAYSYLPPPPWVWQKVSRDKAEFLSLELAVAVFCYQGQRYLFSSHHFTPKNFHSQPHPFYSRIHNHFSLWSEGQQRGEAVHRMQNNRLQSLTDLDLHSWFKKLISLNLKFPAIKWESWWYLLTVIENMKWDNECKTFSMVQSSLKCCKLYSINVLLSAKNKLQGIKRGGKPINHKRLKRHSNQMKHMALIWILIETN